MFSAVGAVAQLVAHLHGMQRVRGSSPLSSTGQGRPRAVRAGPSAYPALVTVVSGVLAVVALLVGVLAAAATRVPSLERAARQAKEWQGIRDRLRQLQGSHFQAALRDASDGLAAAAQAEAATADAASAATATGLFIRDASILRDGSVHSGAGRCWSGVTGSAVSAVMMRPRYAGSATVLSWFSGVEGSPDLRRTATVRGPPACA